MAHELPSASPRSRRRVDWGRLLTGLVVIACLSGMVFAFSLSRSPEPDEGLPAALEAVQPVPGAPVVPSQSSISADLAFGYDAVLLLNGVELPLDQLDRIVAEAIVSWTPGPEKEYRRLPAGRVCAGVVYWPSTGAQARDGRPFNWCFNVN